MLAYPSIYLCQFYICCGSLGLTLVCFIFDQADCQLSSAIPFVFIWKQPNYRWWSNLPSQMWSWRRQSLSSRTFQNDHSLEWPRYPTMVPVYWTLFPSLTLHFPKYLGQDYLQLFQVHWAILVSAPMTSFWCFGEAPFPVFPWSPSQTVLLRPSSVLPWRWSQREMLVLFYVGTLPLIDEICCQRLGSGCLRCLTGSGLLSPNLSSHRVSNLSLVLMFSQRDLLACSLADSEANELVHHG